MFGDTARLHVCWSKQKFDAFIEGGSESWAVDNLACYAQQQWLR